MEAYSLELTDKNGRPVIKKPINIDGLLRREDRSMDIGKGMRVYLEDMPPSGVLPRGYEAQYHPNDPYAMHAASQRHGFDDSVHAPFGFGEVQQWFDVIQAVQQGNQHATEADDARGAAQRRVGSSSPKRAPSPERLHASGIMHHSQQQHHNAPLQPPIPPASMSQREQWASYAPSLPGGPRDFKRVVALDVTPDPKMRKFSPLPMALHSCVMVEKGASGSAHFLVFGGTNGRSDEAEWYEFSLASASWRRIEGKRHVPSGCHSHSCVALQHGARIAVIGGVSYDGQSHVPDHLVAEHPAAVKRLSLLCPKSTVPTRLGRTAVLLDSSRQHQSQPAGATGGGRGPVLMDTLIPQLAAASGVHLSASPTGRGRKRRAFQSVAYDTDVATMRWRMVQPPVAMNIAAHTATVFGSMVYLFGGVNELMEVSDKLIACNPTNYSARILRAQDVAPCARYYHSAVAYGHWIVVYGGFNANNEPLNDIWAFDCVHESWEQLTTVGQPPPRAGHAACVVGCRMLLIGGFDAAIDSEDATPLNTVVEVNLVPTAKGYLLKSLPVGGSTTLPPIAFATATACGDFVSVFVFGGITVKPKKKRAAVDGARAKQVDQSSDAYSSDEDFDEHANAAHSAAQPTAGAHAGSHIFAKFPVTNKAFLLTFAEAKKSLAKRKDDGPKLNHLGLVIDENELSPAFRAFVRKQEDFNKKREFERLKTIRKTRLEETEAAEVSLYLKPAEIESLLAKCEVCCTTLNAYDMKTLPSHVPDKDERARMIEECIGNMKQARDVMRSMKGHEGPKQVKSKGHRKKTGEKFEDHSAAKPFRRVIVMDLIHSTNRYMVGLRKMNKSLKTVEWPEKAAYLHYVHEIHRELVELVDLIKEILEQYINNRVESLVKAEEKHQQNLAKLKDIVAKIQHDKVFKKNIPDAHREHRKQVLLRDDRRNKDDAAGKKQKRRRRSRSASPGSKHAALPAPGKEFKEVLIEVPKEEGKQLMKRCEWVQKAATEFAWHCANTMSVQQPVVTADGVNPQAPPPQRTVQQETILRDADAARSAAITLSNAIASASYAFRTMLEADVTATSPTPAGAAATQQQSAVASAKASQAEATAANATVLDPQAPPIVPALPKEASAEKARDPVKNMMLRLSSVRPLLDNHASLRDLLHTIGRIRLNHWDPNDLGGPKQDEQAEKLSRALFHRQSNLLTRVNAAFLMHKGARSPRQKVHREDPLMMTSDAMQQKLKARKVASPHRGAPTVVSSHAIAVPAITATTGLPSSAPQAPNSIAGRPGDGLAAAGHPYPIQRYDGASGAGRAVVNAPAAQLPDAHMTFYRPMAPMEQTFAYAMPPSAATDGRDGGAEGGPSPHAWFLNPIQYEGAATASGKSGAGTSTLVKAPPAAPTELFAKATPPPAEAVVQLHGAAPPRVVMSPTTSQPVSAGSTTGQAPVSKPVVAPTDASLPPARSSTPPPQQATGSAAPAVPPPSSTAATTGSTTTTSGAGATQSSTSTPSAAAPAATAGPVTVQSYAAATSGAAMPSQSASAAAQSSNPPVSPVPVAPPAWMKVPSMALPPSAVVPKDDKTQSDATATTGAAATPPVPVSVAPGPFNGGIGFLGTHAPIEDYMAIMMPTPAAVGVPQFPPSLTAKKETVTTAGRTVHSAGGAAPAATSTNPNFRGKLTPGERMILKSRDSNRH